MITYKPIIIPGGRRKDGTWPVKIRVTFKGVARRLPTTLTCADQDLTRSGKIKNATILEKANELISRMRATTDTLSPFTLEAWDVDQVIDYIRTTLTSQSFRLDFIAFGREFILGKAPGTRAGYTTALNAFARFLGKEAIDVNAITRTLLVQFQEWADQQGRIFYNYRKGTYQETGKATVQEGTQAAGFPAWATSTRRRKTATTMRMPGASLSPGAHLIPCPGKGPSRRASGPSRWR